jgi:hypothetical protein
VLAELQVYDLRPGYVHDPLDPSGLSRTSDPELPGLRSRVTMPPGLRLDSSHRLGDPLLPELSPALKVLVIVHKTLERSLPPPPLASISSQQRHAARLELRQGLRHVPRRYRPAVLLVAGSALQPPLSLSAKPLAFD